MYTFPWPSSPNHPNTPLPHNKTEPSKPLVVFPSQSLAPSNVTSLALPSPSLALLKHGPPPSSLTQEPSPSFPIHVGHPKRGTNAVSTWDIPFSHSLAHPSTHTDTHIPCPPPTRSPRGQAPLLPNPLTSRAYTSPSSRWIWFGQVHNVTTIPNPYHPNVIMTNITYRIFIHKSYPCSCCILHSFS
ncbi:hypothetical protein PIB30_079415 [Stylosanthes scabra]|uniref:Uncharacterized protein n=1 Tax=Stylosanthes scabra TaxID=79078 RepID=A0ABU6WSA5_9FABA|nr:hypothetical protein [Stylosanthes scabra]